MSPGVNGHPPAPVTRVGNENFAQSLLHAAGSEDEKSPGIVDNEMLALVGIAEPISLYTWKFFEAGPV